MDEKLLNQYCRYCAYMCCGDANYCEKHNECYSDSKIKRVNHCKEFAFNPIDVLNPNNKYKPRDKKDIKEEKTLFNL